MESNDSPEIPNRGETLDTPGLSSGGGGGVGTQAIIIIIIMMILLSENYVV